MVVREDQQFLKIFRTVHLANKRAKFKVTLFTLQLHCNAGHLDNVYMPKFSELLPCDWLIRSLS